MRKIFIFFLSVITYSVCGQNVGINNPAPAASALLDLTSTNKGLLVPRVALTATNAAGPVPAPATSLIVYNTATAGVAPNNVLPGFYYWDGSKWISMSGGTGGRDWSLTGNSGTVVGTNFIGTTDTEPLMFKTNNQKAGYLDYTSPYTTAFGYQALNLVTGNYNSAFGYQSLLSNTSGHSNSALGSQSLYSNTTGYRNVAIGFEALKSNTIGYFNTAIGSDALTSNTTAKNNTAVGNSALEANTTGENNTAVGNNALRDNTTGEDNMAIGNAVLDANTTGSNNIGIGESSLADNLTGSRNIAIGGGLTNNISSSDNIAIGESSLGLLIFSNGGISYSSENIAIGKSALFLTNPANATAGTSGKQNVAIGVSALAGCATGFRNTGIGTNANVNATVLNNTSALGYNAIATANNYVRIGNTAVTSIFGAVAFNTSDSRFKTNVKENVPGLDFIMHLRPVTYHFEKLIYSRHIGETRDSVNESELQRQDALGKVSSGFIAQEVEQLADSLGYDFDGLYKPQNDKDAYGLGYQQFVVPLIKAVQEQQKIILEDRERITRLEKQNAELLELVNKK